MAQSTMSSSTVVETTLDVPTGTSLSHADILTTVLKTIGPELIFVAVGVIIALSMRGLRRRSGVVPTAKKLKIVRAGRADAGHVPKQASPEKKSFPAPMPRSQSAVPPLPPIALSQLVDQAIGIRLSTAKTLAYYKELREAGKHRTLEQDLSAAGSKHTAADFYASLVQCAGRSGRPQVVEELLDDMVDVGVTRSLAIYESSMRLLAGKKCYMEAINVYDRLEKDGLKPSPTTLSCLVGFATELGELDRAIYFFKLLEKEDVPSVRACMCILRVYGKRKEWTTSVELLQRITKRGAQVDSIMFNIVLATGISVGKIDEAMQLLCEMPGKNVADIVSYNIILKGLAQVGKVDRALALLHAIAERGISPNLITFNTAMDAAVRAHRSDDAWRLYGMMLQECAFKPDKCTCSTLVKGLYQNHDETPDRIDSILALIDHCIDECSATLRSSLLSGALEAACRLPSAPLALRAYAKMQEQEISLTAAELRNLALTTARAGDVSGSNAVWLRIQTEPGELEAEKVTIDKLLRAGHRLDAAILQTLGPSVVSEKQPAK